MKKLTPEMLELFELEDKYFPGFLGSGGPTRADSLKALRELLAEIDEEQCLTLDIFI